MEENKKILTKDIRCLSNVIKRVHFASPVFKECENLTGMHSYVLGYLSRESVKRDVFQRDLEAVFEMRRSTASEILKLMEKNGLIERKSVEYDGRLKRLFLTEKGRSLNGMVRQEFDQFEARLSSMLSEEDEARLEEIIDKLTRGLMDDKKEVL